MHFVIAILRSRHDFVCKAPSGCPTGCHMLSRKPIQLNVESVEDTDTGQKWKGASKMRET